MKLLSLTVFLLLFSPISYTQEWVRQNPFATLSQMYDIDFDGPYGLAVGADAMIFTTTNGGTTWKQGTSFDSTKTLLSAFVVPGTSGKVMLGGGDDYLLMTENGGQFWKITYNYIPSPYKIQSLPGGIIMTLGSNFGLRTSDQGRFWQPFNMPGMGVTAGHFTSIQKGWVAYGPVNNQQVWVTTNGGTTWTVRDPLKHSVITSIDMINDQVGFLSSRDFIYKTTDGGYHWEPLHDIASEGGITDLHVVDEGSLWASLNDGSVYISTSGVWNAVNPNVINSNKTLGIYATFEGKVWTVGKYLSILYSPNFGDDWSDQIPANKETMFEPSFFNEFIGMVGGSNGAILKTINSGAKWEKISFPSNESFNGLEMVDENVIVAGSTSGKVFLSDNQGATWTTIGQNLGKITDLKAFNRYEIIVTTEQGRIYKTSDGGVEWIPVYNNAADHLYGLYFFDHQSGWATGWKGKVLMTTNGGETWTPLFNDKRNTFSDVHFTSMSEGWAVSALLTDTVWHTFNGGQSWQKVFLPIKSNWRAVSFMNADIGWITGGSDGYGIVLRTDDGGNNWFVSHESPDALLGVYAIPGQETVWAVGFGGNIVKYASCTSPPDIEGLTGALHPCPGDTVTYVAQSSGVDYFNWTYPEDWIVLGTTNTSAINFIAGTLPGNVTVQGSDACRDTTVGLSMSVAPVTIPNIIISQDDGILVTNMTSGTFQWLLNGLPIQGANNFTHTPLVNGIYQLQFTTAPGCGTISNAYQVTLQVLPEAEWVRQNPFPDLSQMNDIDFDGVYGLAVGNDATILVTTNGGKSWVRQLPSQLAIDKNVSLQTAYVVPGTFGQVMLAAGGGLILMTENAGQLWRISHDEIPSVYKIQSFPGGTLMALGSDFGVFTTDNGIFWQPFNMPGFGVTAGHFLDTQTGWVAFGDFNNQQVWYTTDRGVNWNILDSLAHPIISSIEMINDHEGFLSSRDYIYKTIDGGQNWLPLHSIASDGGITDLHVVDHNNLWASLNNGFVYFSTDGGAIWQEVNPNVINSNRTLGIWANTTGEVWMVGKYVSILHSPNFGVDWSDQFPAAKETMFEPNFYNEFVGMVGASDGTIMKTKNSGAIWEKITFPRNENFFGLTMVDEDVVVAGSSSGKVFLTESQGDVWIVVGENLGQITDLFAFNRYEILVTTEGGKIYKTSDGGTQWDIVHDNPADLLSGIDFYDHQFGWVTGWSGKILTTIDGGESWAPLWSEGINQFTDVQFNSATEGWFVSSSFTDTLWHTNDAGQTLLPSVLPVKTFWRAISFMNADTGWVTGGSNGYGVVLRTDDGGNSWYLSHESPDALMGIYAVPGQETVWAVGFGGNIVKYSSCSAPPDITELRGNLEPCAGDTVNFVVEFNGVDLFDWEFPTDWFVVGNSNTSSIKFITGSTPGLVNVQGRNACGDTTAQLSVSVFPVVPPEVIISQDNGDLVANTASGFFQWYLNGVPIPGAESSTYHPTVSGIYQLHLLTFTSGCETFSNELEVIITATHFSDSDQLMVYPNPAKDILYILYADGKSIPEGSKITLTNVNGRAITSVLSGNDHITLQGLPSGIYSLQIQSGKDLFIKKIMIE